MAYYSGTAASLTALRTALLTHAQADGWVLTGDVLSKAGVYFRIQETATNITCLGCESNAVLNPAPGVVQIGKIYERDAFPIRQMSFPCNYNVFGFTQELYLVANYDVDSYQWMAFGKTSVPGVPGQGGWCGASIGDNVGKGIDSGQPQEIAITSSSGGNGQILSGARAGAQSAALFWSTVAFEAGAARNSWVNSGLDAEGWLYGSSSDTDPVGIRHLSVLLQTQPSVWNSEAVLLPIRCYKARPSFKASLIADLANSRLIRINNLGPGDILTLGANKWKVFPWYRKNLTYPNGGVFGNYNHSGTFGWAIRYEGP